jgi:D-beta-D-heptose 7-phosphate kinase/D-beta-D-heptose 1-phosphate adenosyltransferase
MKKIWTNGCFDIVHIGHIKLFEFAKSLGDILYVGIDDDNRIKQNKGYNRPINHQLIRKEFLSNIKNISDVFIFSNNDELKNLIKVLNIDTIVVGEDYKDKYVVGSEYCNNIIFFPKMYQISTSKIINNEI